MIRVIVLANQVFHRYLSGDMTKIFEDRYVEGDIFDMNATDANQLISDGEVKTYTGSDPVSNPVESGVRSNPAFGVDGPPVTNAALNDKADQSDLDALSALITASQASQDALISAMQVALSPDNATQAELDAAVAALNVALGDKVDQSVYDAMVAGNATDAELAAVESAIDAEIATIQAAQAAQNAAILSNSKGDFLGHIASEVELNALTPDAEFDWMRVTAEFQVGLITFPVGDYYWNGAGWLSLPSLPVAEHNADSQLLSGTIDADALLASMANGQAFHFQTTGATTLTSAQTFGESVDGASNFGFPSYSMPAGVQGHMTRGVGGIVVKYVTIPDAAPDICEINEFIHNIADFQLAFAHEGTGGTSFTVTVNGVDATYENLTNATDNGGGSLSLSGGVNGNFNRLASTVESIREVGDYFEITKPVTGQFDTQIVSITKTPEIAGNLQFGTYRLRFNGTQCDLLDPSGAVVSTTTPEQGVYRIIRTLAGFEFLRNGANIHQSVVAECTDYNTVTATSHVFDGLTVDAAPAWDNGGTPLATTAAYQSVDLGVDLTDVDSLIIHYRRDNNTWPKQAIVPLRHVIRDADQGFMIHWFDSSYIGLRLNSADETAGIVNFRHTTSAFEILEIEFKRRAAGVSRRLGEMVHLSSARFADDAAAIAEGYLPVKPGTVLNGATDYPLWAGMHPEFVSGNDIVFPADVDGMFLRNVGGDAAAEGAFQAGEIQSHTHTYQDTEHNQFTGSGSGSNVARRGSINPTQTTAATGGVETRPVNRAYQIYTVIDTYVDAVGSLAVAAPTAPATSVTRVMSISGEVTLPVNTFGSPGSMNFTVPEDGLYDVDLYARVVLLAAATDNNVIWKVVNTTDGVDVTRANPQVGFWNSVLWRADNKVNESLGLHGAAKRVPLVAGKTYACQISSNKTSMLYGIGSGGTLDWLEARKID